MAVTVVGNSDLIPSQAVHSTCKSILEYFPPDIKHGETEEYRPKPYRYITCPVCYEHYTVKDKHPAADKLSRVILK